MNRLTRKDGITLSTQRNLINQLLVDLATPADQQTVEDKLSATFQAAPNNVVPNSDNYYSMLNQQLYRFILKHYQHNEEQICLWRFIRNLSDDQLNYQSNHDPELKMLDHLLRIYFYSEPLDDLNCIFIPICDQKLIKKYLEWIKSYFYNVNYPTSLLWLYALDSSVLDLFPDELIYLGKRVESLEDDIIIPDFDYPEAVLFKRYSSKPGHYMILQKQQANSEFQQIFTFLQKEYVDRCLSRSGKYEGDFDKNVYHQEWEKFERVLKFGVSDRSQNGCVSFSDMRSSTEFLNNYGKDIYLNKIQQPFFESTKLISRHYRGRIDKFMGDNVMCVFLNRTISAQTYQEQATATILNNLFALFRLCQVLHQLIVEQGFTSSNLGLRSGVTYGSHILRSNLGNEIVRDFTVTGRSVNLAARLEHISTQELILHNQDYFRVAVDRFPQVSQLMSLKQNYKKLNPETKRIVEKFTLYQNILSNLEKLSSVKFDIRLNQEFYDKLRQHLLAKGYSLLNKDVTNIYGYEEFQIEEFKLKFYFSYYKPKGFSGFEKMWILPLSIDVLEELDIEIIQ